MAGRDNAHKFSSSHNYHYRRRIHFPVGTPVEVNTDDEGLENVYFSATVTLPPSNETKPSKKLFVEYKDLLTSEDGSDPLRESVKLAFLRPAPPPEDNRGGFEPGDVVDAFYKDGWWIGGVARPVEGGDRFVEVITLKLQWKAPVNEHITNSPLSGAVTRAFVLHFVAGSSDGGGEIRYYCVIFKF